MADTNLLNAPDDPKAARAKLKAEQKEYRKSLKEQRKAQKEKEKEFADRSAEISGDNAGGLATIVITALIILIWLAIMALLVKLDVGGFGSDILAPIIKDVPYLNLILPEGAVEKKTTATVTIENPDGTVQTTGGITSLEDALAYIKRLEKALQTEMEENSALTMENETLKAEVARLEPFEQQQKEFYEEKAQFYDEVVKGEYSPDPETYVKWYALIEPEKAAALYQELVQESIDEEAIKSYATTYSGMKAKKAAAIFDEMIDQNKMDLVARILAKMSVETRGDILSVMKEENAARVTQLLEPYALELEPTQVTK